MRPSTTEYIDNDDDDDDDGTIHRTLSAAMRAAVTALAGDVDTQYVYTTTTDGSDLTDVYGPLDVVQLANGTPRLLPAAPSTTSTGREPKRTPRHRDAIAWSLPLPNGAASAPLVLL